MQIIRNIWQKPKNNKNSIFILGNFDGVHKAHQTLLKKAIEIKEESPNKQIIIMTFFPNPSIFFRKKNIDNNNFNILPISERLKKLRSFKVDIIYLIQFNEYIANITAETFIENILINNLNISDILVGYDCKFGHKQLGNIQLLKKYNINNNFSIWQQDPIKEKYNGLDKIISSTYLRELIKEGNINLVNKLLTYNYFIKGIVTKGKQLGRQINFPTANIELNKKIILPKFGVYKSRIIILDKNNNPIKQLNSIANIGIKPTVGCNKPLLEVYIFDFSENIYNIKVIIEFLEFIRPEKKFNNLNELKKQISLDIKAYLAKP